MLKHVLCRRHYEPGGVYGHSRWLGLECQMKLAHAGMQHNLAFAAGFVLYGAVIANVIAHGVIWASDHKLKWSDLKQGRLYLVAFLLWAATAAFAGLFSG